MRSLVIVASLLVSFTCIGLGDEPSTLRTETSTDILVTRFETAKYPTYNIVTTTTSSKSKKDPTTSYWDRKTVLYEERVEENDRVVYRVVKEAMREEDHFPKGHTLKAHLFWTDVDGSRTFVDCKQFDNASTVASEHTINRTDAARRGISYSSIGDDNGEKSYDSGESFSKRKKSGPFEDRSGCKERDSGYPFDVLKEKPPVFDH